MYWVTGVLLRVTCVLGDRRGTEGKVCRNDSCVMCSEVASRHQTSANSMMEFQLTETKKAARPKSTLMMHRYRGHGAEKSVSFPPYV